jgi:indoleacetamide hydrolase
VSGGKGDRELAELHAHEAVEAMRRGDLSAERYAAALLRGCAAAGSLNAFITLEPERVLEAARECDRRRQAGAVLGPLHGLPIAIKDSINTHEYPTTAGTPALRHFKPAQDAAVVSALKSAGALVLGKTNLHELSFGWTSNNQAFGAVRNPYDGARIAGGSSGGSAAAVAARLCALALAADTEGSIRVPAALCGVAGFRPSTGRYPNSGVVPISPHFDQVGPHARSVADLAMLDAVLVPAAAPIVAPTPTLAGVRLAIDREYWFADLDPEVERVAAEALRRLEYAGVELVEAPVHGLAELIRVTTAAVQNHEFAPAVTQYLERYHTGVSFVQLLAAASADVRAEIAAATSPAGRSFVPESVYLEARDRYLPQLRALLERYFADTGAAAIVFPATRIAAPLIGESAWEIAGKRLGLAAAVVRSVAPGSTGGLPGMVLPAGLTRAGLPVSLEFDGPRGADRVLLGIGLSFEGVLGRLPAPAVGAAPIATR